MGQDILEYGGSDVDIVTGQPPDRTPSRQEIKAQKHFENTVKGAIDLAAELQGGNPVIRLLLQQYRGRLVFLAAQDPECKALEGILAKIGHVLTLAPVLAEEHLRRVAGPQLSPFFEDTQVAPLGIPASE